MTSPIIAIGLDAADPALLEMWMDQGHLKNLNQLRQAGRYGRLHNTIPYVDAVAETSSTERLWVMALTGCLPYKTGYWGTVKYDPSTYEITHDEVESGYSYEDIPPFYALGNDYKVSVFDVPVAAISDQVNGIQVFGWGGHFPFTQSRSNPPELFSEILRQYGENPVLYKDHGTWWNPKFLNWLQSAINESLSTRTELCLDLLRRDSWDLFLTTFGETHSAEHIFWHLSQADHPLYPHCSDDMGCDPLLETLKGVDHAIGTILAAAPENTHVLVFAVHGMESNVTDLCTTAFLGELLYRYNFPGRVAIAPGQAGTTPPPVVSRPITNSWSGAVWRRTYDPNPIRRLLQPVLPSRFLRSGASSDLVSPYELHDQAVALGKMPNMWYRPLWPAMKAFALPAFADGHIRINLEGRERDGIVPISEYDSLCNELTQLLYRLRDGRTGNPVVKQIVRTRRDPLADDSKLLAPDLVVVWHHHPVDVLDSPDLGRIGPLPYARTGGHRDQGFLLAKGPGIAANSEIRGGQAIDLAPTILSLLGAPLPDYLDGKPLLEVSVRV